MINYSLSCAKGHEFDGWFRNSDAFDAQAEKQEIACPYCGDRDVSKAVMAPAVGAKTAAREARREKAEKMRKMMAEVQDYVETNFDDVGDEFPDEARRIFYGDAEARGIYGNASDEEAEELAEEGLPVGRLPWRKRTDS